MDYCDVFISCLDSHSDGTHSLQWTHWWASDVILHFSEQVPMKKQTHLHLGWPAREYIFSKFAFLGEIPLIKCPYYGLWKFNILVLGSWHACKFKKLFYCLIIFIYFFTMLNDSQTIHSTIFFSKSLLCVTLICGNWSDRSHFHLILPVMPDKAAFVSAVLLCVQRYRENLYFYCSKSST